MIKEIVADYVETRAEDIKLDDTLQSLGLDSLDVMDLVVELENAFDIQLEEGNQLVMCSDGLSNMVTDEEIFELICREDGEDKAKRLIDKANANGGRDNIAVIVVEPFTNEVKEC